MEKKISVIIPVYNVEKYLRECLDSVISQSLKEIEIVCVNDGSKDGSREILSEYERKDERIIVVDKENGGLSSARNYGLPVASGKYILFLDSDDFLNTKHALIDLYQKAEGDKLEQLFFNADVFFESDEIKEQNANYIDYYKRKKDYPAVRSGKDLFCELQSNWDFKPHACLQLFLRDFLTDNHLTFHEDIIHEDEVFTLECVTFSRRAAYIDMPYLTRRIRENSIMTTSRKAKSIYGYYHGIMILLEFAQKHLSVQEEPFSTFFLQRIQVMMELAAKSYPQNEEEKREIVEGIDTNGQFAFTANMNAWKKIISLKERLTEKSDAYEKICKEKQELETEKKKLETEIEDFRQSTSYKVGKIVTWGPRKAKKALRVVKRRHESQKRDIYLIGTPEFGNLGDHMISEVELELLYTVYPKETVHEITMDEYWEKKEELKSKIKPQDMLIFHGGGNVGNLWPKSEYIRRDAFSVWKEQRKIIMPQSICFTNDEEGKRELEETKKSYTTPNLLLCCRDEASYRFSQEKLPCNSIYVPDTVLFHEPQKVKRASARSGALLCLRADKEKKLSEQDKKEIVTILKRKYSNIIELDTVGEKKTRETRRDGLQVFFDQIRKAELVVTDRLHGMIFCALTGTPCIALDNSYQKVYGTYEWLETLEYIQYITDVGELEKWLNYTWKEDYKYPFDKYRKLFQPLLQGLKSNN